MRRLIAILFLLPVIASAQITNIATGNWTNSAIWAGGTIPTFGNAAAITGYTVTVSSPVTVGTLTWTATVAANNFTNNGYLTISNQFVRAARNAVAGTGTIEIAGGNWSNATVIAGQRTSFGQTVLFTGNGSMTAADNSSSDNFGTLSAAQSGRTNTFGNRTVGCVNLVLSGGVISNFGTLNVGQYNALTSTNLTGTFSGTGTISAIAFRWAIRGGVTGDLSSVLSGITVKDTGLSFSLYACPDATNLGAAVVLLTNNLSLVSNPNMVSTFPMELRILNCSVGSPGLSSATRGSYVVSNSTVILSSAFQPSARSATTTNHLNVMDSSIVATGLVYLSPVSTNQFVRSTLRVVGDNNVTINTTLGTNIWNSSTLVLEGSTGSGNGTISASGTTLDSVECPLGGGSRAIGLASALACDSFSNSMTVKLNGFSLNATSLTQTSGVFVASNSTVTATTIRQTGGTYSNMTSTVLVSQSSNLTNYWSLAPAGTVTLTNAAISVSGTLAGQAGSSINLGTLTLSNPGFVPMVSNVTLPAASQPLNATTTRNAGGKLNDLMRRGAE